MSSHTPGPWFVETNQFGREWYFDVFAPIRDSQRADDVHLTGERSAVAGDGPLVRFGRDKGKPIADVDDLSWYRAALQTGVEDPSKARFLEQNRAHLEEVDTELRARGGR